MAEERAHDTREWMFARLVYVIQLSAAAERVKKPELPVLLRYRPGD